ncbi:MAG: hypothetical protein A2Z20_02315 [Bdellovibrionales bacterium RBG_16_40_8]|nr:MAG: hypothetical protein A2Z20_02315 [Bdellovibrionales bacterium RBG_16_40_8]
MKKHIFMALVISMSTSFMTTSSAFSADAKKEEAKPLIKEARQKMAEIHTKMAGCLNSDKSMKECRGDMMKNCQETMGKEDCPMMGKMGHGNMMGEGEKTK